MKEIMTIKPAGGQRTFLMKDTKVEEFKKWATDNGYQIIRIDKAEGFEAWCRAYITERKNRF